MSNALHALKLSLKKVIHAAEQDRPDVAQPRAEWRVRQQLVRTLQPGGIVILDNLALHKRVEVRDAILEANASLLFLPPYSPDMSPIEQAISKVKRKLRDAKERTIDGLWQCFGRLLACFPRERMLRLSQTRRLPLQISWMRTEPLDTQPFPKKRCVRTPCYPIVLPLNRLPLAQLPLARRASEGHRKLATAHSFANSLY